MPAAPKRTARMVTPNGRFMVLSPHLDARRCDLRQRARKEDPSATTLAGSNLPRTLRAQGVGGHDAHASASNPALTRRASPRAAVGLPPCVPKLAPARPPRPPRIP